MKQYPLPYFDQIDITSLDEYYNVEAKLNDNIIRLDINFDKKSIDENTYQNINTFLENINNFDEQNKSLIDKDLKESGQSLDYINFYLDELDQNELATIIDIDDANNPKDKQLINKLKLIRIGLYPDGKYGADYFGVFDYSIDIDGEPCNQLLVVKTNKTGELDHITWES